MERFINNVREDLGLPSLPIIQVGLFHVYAMFQLSTTL
jgi:hypothetical protein